MKHKVYWVHYPHQTNPRVDGYIGITQRKLYNRRASHKYANPNPLLRELASDKTVIWEVIHDNLSQHEAMMIEIFYRPVEGIGYNKNKGGKPYYPKKQRGAKRTVVNRYSTSPFYIDDMM